MENFRGKLRDYYRTAHWRLMRRMVVRRSRGHCECCDKYRFRLTVHHLTYERLGAERFNDLVALCWSCHRRLDQLRGIVDGSYWYYRARVDEWEGPGCWCSHLYSTHPERQIPASKRNWLEMK